MFKASMIVRGVAVVAFIAAPVAAIETTPIAKIKTGDATANGPGFAVENTGGNVEFGTAKVNEGPPIVIEPVAPEASPNALSLPAKPVNPADAAIARANKLVADARARAQKLIDDAKARAEAAVEQAHQNAADAQAHGQAQSDAARQRSADASAQAHS